MTGHRDFRSLVSRRVRVRAKLIGLWWRLRARVGRCDHPGSIGPAGGDIGWCAVCGAVVPWETE